VPDRQTTAVWAAVSGVTIGEAWLRRHEVRSPRAIAKFEDAMKQLARGVPFAYAVGTVGFRDLDLAIDPRALIPRPETEGLVELVLKSAGTGYRVPGGVAADIGTGSGCIALSLAMEGSFERVVAVERSPGAAALARENVALVQPRTPVDVREGDLLEPLGTDRYRVIVANPPYLTDVEYTALDPSVRAHEPREALASGPDGLTATRAILAGAAERMEPRGVLALEIDERRATEVRSLGAQYGWGRVEIHHDLFGCKRYALAFREA
jgi:release factor glutamine methyltransferase